MRKWLRSLVLSLLLVNIAQMASAQTVDVVYGIGRVFDIPSATWMNFHVPGIEVSSKGFIFNLSHFLDMDGKSNETDLTASYKKEITKRLTTSILAAQLRYHMPFWYGEQRKSDWRFFIEGRYRLWQK